MKKYRKEPFYAPAEEFIVSITPAPENTWIVHQIKDFCKDKPDWIVGDKVIYYALLKTGFIAPMVQDAELGLRIFEEIYIRYHFGPYENIHDLGEASGEIED